MRLALLPLVLGSTVALAVVPSGAARTGCTANATESLVRTFVAAYGRGNVAAADRLWAREPRFEWFSTGPPGARQGRRAYDRSTLARYLAARMRVHERIRLAGLRAAYDPKRDIVDVRGKVVRNADGLRPRRHEFKAAADCVSGHPTLIVWSM